ncbi:unnamed protein product [Trifolium pratense]|uniref:Uncharacterized protein n=1 Tax=Trifolium pratense TaxID=57577 RepID=A0ACB0KBB8_TRIPR|nr:unnamed protein product [Trifolium pratense]
MDFLGDTNVASATDVVVFVPDIIETNLKLHVSFIIRLLDTFYQIHAARVCPCALWIIGDLPFYTIYEDGGGQETWKAVQQMNLTTVSSRRLEILAVADGTYATQSAALATCSSGISSIVQSVYTYNSSGYEPT